MNKTCQVCLTKHDIQHFDDLSVLALDGSLARSPCRELLNILLLPHKNITIPRFFEEVHKTYKTISKHDVNSFFKMNEYLIQHAQLTRRAQTKRTKQTPYNILGNKLEYFEVDILIPQKRNQTGKKTILMAIDQISRYLFYVILPSKSSASSVDGMKTLITKIRTKQQNIYNGLFVNSTIKMASDYGREFNNSKVRNLLRSSNVKLTMEKKRNRLPFINRQGYMSSFLIILQISLMFPATHDMWSGPVWFWPMCMSYLLMKLAINEKGIPVIDAFGLHHNCQRL